MQKNSSISAIGANFIDEICLFQHKFNERTPSRMNQYLRFFDYDEAFEYYCGLIGKMRQGSNTKVHSRIIAKPALILAIIKLIEDSKTINRFAYEELEPVYKSIFGQHFIEARQYHLTPLCYPFYYMKTDLFWHLVWTNAETSTGTPSAAWIGRNTKYACIDHELWVLLLHEPYRNKMKEYIIEEKIMKVFCVENKGKGLLKAFMHLLMVV